jgi:hypothetical protein
MISDEAKAALAKAREHCSYADNGDGLAAVVCALEAVAHEVAALREAVEPPPPPYTSSDPHSRACGVRPHAHGWQCHDNCPTCHGTPIPPARYAPN